MKDLIFYKLHPCFDIKFLSIFPFPSVGFSLNKVFHSLENLSFHSHKFLPKSEGTVLPRTIGGGVLVRPFKKIIDFHFLKI